MKKALILFFAFFAVLATAQEKQKAHFIIHKLDPAANISKYELAAQEFGKLDDFRYYDQRRTIRFTDGKASLELFSAKELLDTYGKVIAPGTIMDPTKAREITFDITLDGKGLKPQFVK